MTSEKLSNLFNEDKKTCDFSPPNHADPDNPVIGGGGGRNTHRPGHMGLEVFSNGGEGKDNKQIGSWIGHMELE